MSNHEREDPRSGDGDAALDRAWRQASGEVPPAQLDAAILAAARKATEDRDDSAQVIHTGRRPRRWLTGWQPLAAAAGVAGLAFILVLSLPQERDVAPATWIESDASSPTGTPGDSPSPSAREAKEEAAAVAASAQYAPRAKSSASALDPGSTAGGTAVLPAAEVDQRRATVSEPSSQALSKTAAAPAGERLDVAPLSAEDWAARVVALYSSGDVAGAAVVLREFRVADPEADTYLPDSLRDWAGTVE